MHECGLDGALHIDRAVVVCHGLVVFLVLVYEESYCIPSWHTGL